MSGLAVTVVDTAGLREGAGRIEALGIERTREALKGADVAVLVLPPEASANDRSLWRSEVDQPLEVEGKADLPGAREGALRVSGLTGAGVDQLRALLAARLGAGAAGATLSTSERHVHVLTELEAALSNARAAVDVATLEIVAGELNLAVHALAELTGEDASTQLLDAIFQRFCIGK